MTGSALHLKLTFGSSLSASRVPRSMLLEELESLDFDSAELDSEESSRRMSKVSLFEGAETER